MKKYLPTSYTVGVNSRRLALSERSESKGFTLIELMVVITIIAFLSVIGIVAFSNIQAQARDGRRRADIDAIATAMEANRTGAPGSQVYPAYSGTIFANSVAPCDPLDSTPSTCSSSTTQISYGGTSGYGYVVTVVTTSPSTFVACALLEKGNGNAAAAGATGTTHYCRKSQQ